MSVLESAIGWLAPPQCLACGVEGLVLCKDCSTTVIRPFEARCWRCSALSQRVRACANCRPSGGPRAVWISTSYQATAQQLMRRYKFGQLRAVAVPIANLMARTFLDFHESNSLEPADYLVVPLPTATSRLRQRGFDHSALLAKKVARQIKRPYSPVMGRLDQSRQLGAARELRLSQTAGNYFVRRPALVAGRDILLIDDVITTGGTITEATKVLRAAGARHVDVLVFAKRL